MATLDFRANQVRTTKIISSGSTGTGAKILIYDVAADSTSDPNYGNINTAAFNTGSIGTNIFLYVSGTVTASSSPRIAAFGGDVFVSGTLSSGLTKNFVPIGSYISTAQTSSNPQVAGQAWLSLNEVPRNNVFLRTILSTTTGTVTGTVELYNITAAALVHIGGVGITTLTTTQITPTVKESVNLVNATNFNTGSGAVYEVRVYIDTGSQSVIHGSSMFVCGG